MNDRIISTTSAGERALIYERAGPTSRLKTEARRAERIAISHPDGYQGAFAVLYRYDRCSPLRRGA